MAKCNDVTLEGTEDKEPGCNLRVQSEHPIIPTLPYYFEMTIVRLEGAG